MIIYAPDGSIALEVEVDDSSYYFNEIMSKEELTLSFSLPIHTPIPVGSYCIFEGRLMELLYPENINILHRRAFEYNLVFEGGIGRTRKYIVHDVVDGRVVFPMTATPAQHIQMIVDNLNQRESATWEVGEVIDGAEKLVSYSNTSCKDALTAVADAFETEFEIISGNGTFTVNLGKVERNKTAPLALSYGEQGGFLGGVSKTNGRDSLSPVKVYVQGGDKNIVLKDYGNAKLLLPKGETFSFDGEHFSGESGYDSSKAIQMQTSADGLMVSLYNAPDDGVEDSVDLSNIYPKRFGTVSNVLFWDNTTRQYVSYSSIGPTEEDWENIRVHIVDNDPDCPDYSECLIANNEPLTIIFQSGQLAGREFDCSYYPDSLGAKPAQRFELKPTTLDGYMMPATTFVPATGQQYAIFNCVMPQEYCEEAEWEMLREAAKYLYEQSNSEYTLRGTIWPVWVKKNWTSKSLASKLVLGGYIRFTDDSIQRTAFDVRILSIKQLVNDTKNFDISLSNAVVSGSVGSSIKQIGSQGAAIDQQITDVVNYYRRGFSRQMELIRMLEGAVEGFTEGITPVSVQTMALLAGSERFQFRFTSQSSSTTDIGCPVSLSNGTIQSTSAYLLHLTWGLPDEIVPANSRTYQAYYIWYMPAYSHTFTASEQGTAFYLYAKVPKATKSGGSGTWELTTDSHDFVEGDYLYLLVGIVSSEVEGERLFSRLYGYTSILPGEVTTDIVKSSDGNSYLNLALNKLHLGGANNAFFDWDGPNRTFSMRGAISIAPDGEEFPILNRRSKEFDTTGATTYYWGDMVTYQGSSYAHTGRTATTNVPYPDVAPTDPHYYDSDSQYSTLPVWTLVAEKGQPGAQGLSAFSLDLSNESAGINCDADGNILPGAIRPTCKATLYYGSTPESNARYYLVGNYTGVSINATTGVMTFGSNFTFSGLTLEITVTAVLASAVVGTAIMTVNKVLPGVNGEPATSYWLLPSADAIHVNPNTDPITVNPSTLTIIAMRQVGENPPEEWTGEEGSSPEIKYGYDTTSPAQNYVQAITVDGTRSFITVHLYKVAGGEEEEEERILVDSETIPILRDGLNGLDGAPGTQGAVIRGPVEWVRTSRRWCSGDGVVDTGDTPQADDWLWHDLVIRVEMGQNGQAVAHHYLCIVSHTTDGLHDFDYYYNLGYWMAAEEYQFIAAKALAVDEAFIRSLTVRSLNTQPMSATESGGTNNGSVNVNDNAVTVLNASREAVAKLHGGSLSQGGASGTFTFSGITITGQTTMPAALTNAVVISSEDNSVTTPKIRLTASASGSNPRPSLHYELYFDAPYISLARGEVAMGSSVVIPRVTVSLPAQISAVALYIDVSVDGDTLSGEQCVVALDTGESATFSVVSGTLKAEIAKDGMRLRFGTAGAENGFSANGSGVKVIQGGTEYNALGGQALNGLDALKRICLCTAYPATLENGVFYIKVSS